MSDINAVKEKYAAQIEAASELRALDDIRVAALGKKGEIGKMMQGFGATSRTAGHGRNGRYLFGYGFFCCRRAGY